jgi:hypothetical protein
VLVAARCSVSFLVGCLLAGIDSLQVGDQFRGDPAADLPGGIAWAHCGQQRSGLAGGEVLLRSTGDQLQEQLVELGDHPGVVLTQRPSPVHQDPQHR